MAKFNLLQDPKDPAIHSKAIEILGSLEALCKRHKNNQDAFQAAKLAFDLIEETGPNPNMTAYQRANYLRLAACILRYMPSIDEPRFSMYDYIDGVINATHDIDIEKLLNLTPDDFTTALVWLANDKRESYEDQPHDQPPLSIDIFAS